MMSEYLGRQLDRSDELSASDRKENDNECYFDWDDYCPTIRVEG